MQQVIKKYFELRDEDFTPYWAWRFAMHPEAWQLYVSKYKK